MTTPDTAPAVIKGKGFNPHGGGFAVLIVDGVTYTADQVRAALAAAPVAPAGEGELDQTVTEVAVSTIRWAIGRGDDLRDYKEPLEHVLIAALRARSEPEAGAVAWAIRYAGDDSNAALAQVTLSPDFAERCRQQGHTVIALSATSDPSATERMRARMDAWADRIEDLAFSANDGGFSAIVKEMRAALGEA